MPNGWPSTSWRTWETMMLGEVPIMVTSPPSREAKAMGISSAEAGVPVRRASCIATGRKIASAPTFLQNTDSSPTEATSTGTCVWGVRRRRSTLAISVSITPERAMAALTIRAAPTMMTMSSEKPSKAWRAGTSPVTTEANSAISATRS